MKNHIVLGTAVFALLMFGLVSCGKPQPPTPIMEDPDPVEADSSVIDLTVSDAPVSEVYLYPGSISVVSNTLNLTKIGTTTRVTLWVENGNIVAFDIASEETNTIKVKKGETLSTIARKHGMSIDKIKQLNGMSGNVIYEGQILKVVHD